MARYLARKVVGSLVIIIAYGGNAPVGLNTEGACGSSTYGMCPDLVNNAGHKFCGPCLFSMQEVFQQKPISIFVRHFQWTNAYAWRLCSLTTAGS